MDSRGLSRIISGGQFGADLGGLVAANDWPLDCGGWAPKGWRTCQGPMPELKGMGLRESDSPSYAVRTRLNVCESDGTILIANNASSPGSKLTIRECFLDKKPIFITNTTKAPLQIQKIADWILSNDISILNVAGNRDVSGSDTHFRCAYSVITEVLTHLKSIGKLNDLEYKY